VHEPMLADAGGVGTFLVGPVAHVLPPELPRLTLDRPWLAEHAPRVQRAQPERWFVGRPLVAYLQRVAAASPDDALRPAIILGQELYQFAEIATREGMIAATAWFEA